MGPQQFSHSTQGGWQWNFPGGESVMGCRLMVLGACCTVEEEEVGSPVQGGPDGTRCIPKALPGRQQGMGSRMPEAGCSGVSAAGAFGNG